MSDIDVFSAATEMLRALEAGAVSSADLVEMHIERIEATDGDINAIPVRTFDRARESARLADAARAEGSTEPLLGVPITLKESTRAAGLPQSAGMPAFAEHVPSENGLIAQRVFDSGACLLGKTNIPFALGDWQADSEVYGRTDNPWDRSRSPGGSTGGGGAALAVGMTPLEIGSDIGGSIRVPAAYCGVYGHRPTETAIPRSGAIPPADRDNPGAIMGVQGPLARSAFDLELLFDVVAGPVALEEVGWRLEVPPARHDRLADFRVAIMPVTHLATPSSAMAGAIDQLAGFVSDAGAKVEEAMPSFDVDEYYADYLTTLMLITTQGMDPDMRARIANGLDAIGRPDSSARARGMRLNAADYLALLDRREIARLQWAEFFESWDVVVCPTTLDSAFPHQTGSFESRTVMIDDTETRYSELVVYPMWAILTGQPATAFPAGLDAAGLPLGLQAIGPYLEDRTTMRFAQLLETDWQGFQPPPAYA